jgi:hypothetical protein
VRKNEDIEQVVSDLKSQDKIIIQSYSKKEEKLLDKDIKPMILDLNIGELHLEEKVTEIIDEVSPCRMPGIYFKTEVKQGAGIRPSEIVELLNSRGLRVERPIKVGIEIV